MDKIENYQFYSKVFVVIIAIEKYKNGKVKTQAVANAQMLKDQFSKMNFEILRFIINEDATTAKILEEISQVRDQLEKIKEQDNLFIFYFNGHVYHRHLNSMYLECYNSLNGKNHLTEYLNVAEITQKISRFNVKHLCIFIDTSISKTFIRKDLFYIMPQKTITKNAALVSRNKNKATWYLCAQNYDPNNSETDVASFVPQLVKILDTNPIIDLLTISQILTETNKNHVLGISCGDAPIMSGIPIFKSSDQDCFILISDIKLGEEVASECNIRIQKYQDKRQDFSTLMKNTLKSAELKLLPVLDDEQHQSDNFLDSWYSYNSENNIKNIVNNQQIRVLVSESITDSQRSLLIQQILKRKTCLTINVEHFEKYISTRKIDQTVNLKNQVLYDFIFDTKILNNDFYPEDRTDVIKYLQILDKKGEIVYFLHQWNNCKKVLQFFIRLNYVSTMSLTNNEYHYPIPKDENIDDEFENFAKTIIDKKFIPPALSLSEFTLDQEDEAKYIHENLAINKFFNFQPLNDPNFIRNINAVQKKYISHHALPTEKKIVLLLDLRTSKNNKTLRIANIFKNENLTNLCNFSVIHTINRIDTIPWMFIILMSIENTNVKDKLTEEFHEKLSMKLKALNLKNKPKNLFFYFENSESKSIGQEIPLLMTETVHDIAKHIPNVMFNNTFIKTKVFTEYLGVLMTIFSNPAISLLQAHQKCYKKEITLIHPSIESCSNDSYLYSFEDGYKNNITLYHIYTLKNDILGIKQLFDSNFPAINLGNKDGKTPLICALWSDKFEIANILLMSKEIDVNIPDPVSGNTALHIACAKFQIRIVKCLIEKGAKINVLNMAETSPIFFAFKYGTMSDQIDQKLCGQKICTFLLQKGADYKRDSDYRTNNNHSSYEKWRKKEPLYCEWIDKVQSNLALAKNDLTNFQSLKINNDDSLTIPLIGSKNCNTFDQIVKIFDTRQKIVMLQGIVCQDSIIIGDEKIPLILLFNVIKTDCLFMQLDYINNSEDDKINNAKFIHKLINHGSNVKRIVCNTCNIKILESRCFTEIFTKCIFKYNFDVETSFIKSYHYLIQQQYVVTDNNPYGLF